MSELPPRWAQIAIAAGAIVVILGVITLMILQEVYS